MYTYIQIYIYIYQYLYISVSIYIYIYKYFRKSTWIFIGKTDAEAPIFWPADAKSQLIGKDADAGKD